MESSLRYRFQFDDGELQASFKVRFNRLRVLGIISRIIYFGFKCE